MGRQTIFSFLLAGTICTGCADFDLIDDIADFTIADIRVEVQGVEGTGSAIDPFVLDVASTMTIRMLDLRDTSANRSLNPYITWESSNPGVAVVDDGLVLGVMNGETTISAWQSRAGDDRVINLGEWEVTVFEFERIVISSESGAFGALQGRQLQLDALYYDNNNQPDPSKEVSWSVQDTDIATIDDTGLVTAIASGTTNILATAVENPMLIGEVSFQVLTNEIDVFRVIIENQITTLPLGDSLQLEAKAYSVNNVEIEESFTWRSEDPSVIEVTDAGLAKAISTGTSAIRAVSSGGIQSDPLVIEVSEEEITVRTGTVVSSRGGTTGTVTLYIDGDQLKLRLNADFFGASIPGPVLFLSNNETSISGGLRIQEIEPGDGENRVFTIPGNPGIMDYDYVIYHCEPFNVIYGSFLLD